MQYACDKEFGEAAHLADMIRAMATILLAGEIVGGVVTLSGNPPLRRAMPVELQPTDDFTS